MTGVAFAGGAYMLTFVVYVMRLEKYHPIVRATVLNGLLAYVFYAGALVLDLGRPWNVINPIIGNSFGYNSVLFLVAWHFMLYMLAEILEFSPAVAEWLGWKRARRILGSMTLGAVIFGVTLSTLHQSGLGALFLMAKPKIHPLWYTEFIPVLFFVSSIFAGLSMVILEGTMSHKVFGKQIDPKKHGSLDDLLLGLGKGAAISLFVYYFFKLLVFVHDRQWDLLATEVGGLVPRRGARLRARAVRDVHLRGAQPPAGTAAAGGGRGAHRRAAQPAEHLGDRLQLAARRSATSRAGRSTS